MVEEGYVLIVDDDEDIRTVTAIALETEGYRVLAASTGADALATVEREGTPSAMLIDLMMPEMDGAELIRALRRSPDAASVPVAIVSGDIAVRERARQLDATPLVKPIDLDELLDVVAGMTKPMPGVTMSSCARPSGSR